MYTVLSGAKINVGDFLITDRCKQILRALRPEHELVQLPHWEPLDDKLDQVNAGAAVIIMGGPGFQKRFYPGVYKLTADLDDIKVPVIPMGLGWKGFPGDFATLQAYRFEQPALDALNRFARRAEYFSCRDYLTKTALERNGIHNVLMTGCPVWYHLESIGQEMRRPDDVAKVAFTPAQKHIYRDQSIEVMGLLRELFRDADLYCSFHRGIGADNEFTPAADEKNNVVLEERARALGFHVVDAAYDLDKIAFYSDCDLHVGYRVHAHLSFLSQRRPSILIHEDGRGNGVSGALSLTGIDGYKKDLLALAADQTGLSRLSDGVRTAIGAIRADRDAPTKLRYYLEAELANRFARFTGVAKVIDAHYEIMQEFVRSLPA